MESCLLVNEDIVLALPSNHRLTGEAELSLHHVADDPMILAAVGLGSLLIGNPLGLLRQILVTAMPTFAGGIRSPGTPLEIMRAISLSSVVFPV